MLKPYLKWAGGKRQLLPEIKKHLPKEIHDYIYYEPFVGAGAFFFDLQPQKAVINDSNAQLMLTYNVIRETPGDLIVLLKKHQKMNDREYYYKIRNIDRDPEEFDALTDVEKAARLIFLNKTCFNGLYRVNSRGQFNVPCGKYKNPAIFDEPLLRQISAYLNSGEVTVLSGDFEYAVSTAGKNSFIYFDPPYYSPDKTKFTGYQADGFYAAEHERLCEVMVEMTKRGVKCLLSNSDTAFIRKLYSHNFFKIITVQAKRPINSDSAGRGMVNEILVKNWKD